MSLRTTILLSVGLTLAALTVGVTMVTSRLMMDSFVRLERRNAEENVRRAERNFGQMVEEINVKSSDWASWDDAYAFMADGNRAFVRSNLTPSALAGLQLDAIVFADREGRLFRSLHVARSSGGPVPNASAVLAALSLKSLSRDPRAMKKGLSGFVSQGAETMLVAVRPILTTAETGPSRGWLVFARLLRGREVDVLRDLTRVEVGLRRVGQGDPDAITIRPLDEQIIEGRAVLRDLDGKPGLELSIRKPRLIYQQGLATMNQVRILVIAVGAIFGAVVLLVLEWAALRRLVRLSSEVDAISAGTSTGNVHISGRDELSALGMKINETLARLRESEERLQRHSANLELTVQTRTQEMAHQAFHDDLTGLPNRALFLERIDFALRKAARTGRGTAALFIDLDNFKLVNDSLGHAVGDALLVEVAAQLLASTRSGDTVARLGGDEFTILLEDLDDVTEAEEIATLVLTGLALPLMAGGNAVFANGSVGIAFAPPGETGAVTLMKNADTAMYRAKAAGKASYVLYDPSMDDEVVERLEIENGLRTALERSEIAVHYQPLIDLATGQIRGAEALARWTHPTLGQVSPERFVPVAEETGLIVPLGYWILETACRQAVEWKEGSALGGFSMSVNLSGRQLQRDDVVERVQGILARTGLAPGCLKLEITESVLMKNHDAVAEKMRRLKRLGVKLALDDFGTGYSSLSILRAFPIDTLKIDRAFVSRLGEEAEATSVVEAIMALSRSMGMDVTGEGVETAFQRRLIQELGCHVGQGYLFDRPLSADDFDLRLLDAERVCRRAA